MKFKVYEVKSIHFNGMVNLEKSFLYINYFDAVNKFKEFIKEAKQVDWVQKGLKRNSDEYSLISKIDYWSFYCNQEDPQYDISIKEREVY